VNAEVEDHCLNVCLCGSTWDNILRPYGVNRKSLQLDDVSKCRDTRRVTYGSKISHSSLNARLAGSERFIFSLSARKTICVGADVAATLKSVLEVNRVPHVDAESKAVDVALEKKGLVGRFIGPFVKKIGKTSLTACITLGGTGVSSCGGRSAGSRRRRSRGCRKSSRTKKVEAKMRFCLQEKNLFPNIKATGVVPGKDGTIRDAGRYVRGAGGLGGRDGGGVFTMIP
jgi:hypothetical protein